MSQTNPETVTLTIDGQTVTVPKGTPLIEAAREIGVEIPHYCYDRDLSVVASCRLCLVEIEKVPKLQPSCSTPVADGQVVYTQSEKVLDARKMQMEFLLVQHPLDCPVCDQGGECKLQDYSRKHGMEDTRFNYGRRTFPKPDIGPFIDLERNRCILCSRCVRFMDEVAGTAELTVVNRGWKSHITTFQERPLQSEFSGNIIDLCPVGALTSKVTRFRTRVWELKSKPSVCSMCSVGCNVHLQHRNRTREILRVVPRLNAEVNYRWICDIGRFGFDQFNHPERLKTPLRKNDSGKQEETTWADVLGKTVTRFREILANKGGAAIAGLIGPRSSNETLFLFQQFFREILQSNNVDHRTEHLPSRNDGGFLTSIALRASNQPFQEIRKASTIVLLGSDLPNELPILHLQIRERANSGATVYSAHHRPTRLDDICSRSWMYAPGSETLFLAALLKRTAGIMNAALSQEMEELLSSLLANAPDSQTGMQASDLDELAGVLNQSEKATLLLGESIFGGKDGAVNVQLAVELAHLIHADPSKPLPLSLLVPHNNSRGAADMGCYPHRGPGFESIPVPGRNTAQILEGCLDGSIQALLLFNTDLLEVYPDRALVQRALEKVPFLAVADAYPYSTVPFADVVFPLSAYSEEEGTYTNVCGRVQRTDAAIEQLPGTLTGYQVLLALGERWGAAWRQVQPARLFEQIAQAVPHYRKLTWSGLSREGTLTGAVDISLFQTAFSSSRLSWKPDNAAPTTAYPYRLVRGRTLFDTGEEKRFAPPLVKRSEPCIAEIHPEDAQSIGIQPGATVTLTGALGSISLPVRLSADTCKGCVTVLGQHQNQSINGLVAEDQPWVKIQP